MSHKLLVKDPRGQREILLVGTMTVGRDPRCDISDADPLLSRRHAEFVVSNDGVLVRDLNSRNGILVNGRKVPQAALQPGDVVQISGLAITLISTRPKAPASAVDEPSEDKTLLVTPPPVKHTPGTMATPGDRVPATDGQPAPEPRDEPATQPGTRPAGQAARPPIDGAARVAAPAPPPAVPATDGTVRVPRHSPAAPSDRAMGPDAGPPSGATIVVPRKTVSVAGSGATGGPVMASTAVGASGEAGTVHVPRPVVIPKGAAAVDVSPGATGVEPTADGPIEKVLGAGHEPATPSSAGQADGTPFPKPPGTSGVPPAESAAVGAAAGAAAEPPSSSPIKAEAPEDGDRTRFMPPPGPVTDLPLRPAPAVEPGGARAAGGAVRAAAVQVTPVRGPSTAAGPWVAWVMAATSGAAVVAALAGAAVVAWFGQTMAAFAAAALAGGVAGIGAGIAVQRRFGRAMQAVTDDLDLAVIGRLEEVGDPFGHRHGRQLADAMNELVARIRTGRS